MADVDTVYWLDLVCDHIHCPNLRTFKCLFGVEPKICTHMLLKYRHYIKKPLHLLWSLNFLKDYSPVHSLASRWNVSTSTFGNAVWFFIEDLNSAMQAEVIVAFISIFFLYDLVSTFIFVLFRNFKISNYIFAAHVEHVYYMYIIYCL